ncbi:MAG TPA: NAD(P)-dependent oxidoreductase [Solirubrobacteraceae bacterium]|jgi:3-hydroxyisobutyrate dehydrogenase-like beta-hydroxyacid dehydrogenase|nr:NAD(P)-dependent oxidoreductase [Solirubrobacteraceae bacterium]
MTAIGFVGLGAMGGRVAGRLLAAGNTVYGTNRTRSRADSLVERGLIWRDSPCEVAEQADVVFSMVTDTAAVEAITGGPRGILAGLRPGSVYVDMSTIGPAASRELADRVRGHGGAMLDAPVSGSVPAAEAGSLAIMVGGDQAAFRRVDRLLRELGQTVTHVGANGQGLIMKLAVNISLAVQMIAFSEGVLLAERGGVDPRLAIEVLNSSAVGSPMLRTRGPLLLDRSDEAWFDLKLMQKDVGLALEEGRRVHVPLPTTASAGDLLSTARTLGFGDQDIVAVFDVLARIAGPDRVAA